MCSIVIEVISFIFINKYGGLLSLMRTLQFYPYFLAGYMMKDKLGHTGRNGNLILQSGGGNFDHLYITDFKQVTASGGFSEGRIVRFVIYDKS